MKKAVVILYVIAAVQAVSTIIGFAVANKIMQHSFYEAGKSMIQIGDARYVQK